MVSGMTLVSLVNLYYLLMIGSCVFVIVVLYEISNFLSDLSTESYDDVSVSVSLLRCVSCDD